MPTGRASSPIGLGPRPRRRWGRRGVWALGLASALRLVFSPRLAAALRLASALRWWTRGAGRGRSALARGGRQRTGCARGRHVAEADLRHGAVAFVRLEEAERLESKGAGDQRGGEGLQLDVVVPHVAVVEAPGELELVLGRGQRLLK